MTSHVTKLHKPREATAEKMRLQTTARKLVAVVQTWRDAFVCAVDNVRRTTSDDDDAEQRRPRAPRSQERIEELAGDVRPCKNVHTAYIHFLKLKVFIVTAMFVGFDI